MKWKAIILGLMISPLAGLAQEQDNTEQDKKEKYARVYSVANKSAVEIYFMASDFARAKNRDIKKDPVNNSVQVDVAIPYEPRANECVEDLALNGKLTIQSKDGKTRIMMDGLTYRHRSAQTGDTIGVAKTNLLQKRLADCAPSSGTVEQLYNCTECRQSVNHVDNTLQAYFDQVAGEYQQHLKNEILTSNIR